MECIKQTMETTGSCVLCFFVRVRASVDDADTVGGREGERKREGGERRREEEKEEGLRNEKQE